MFTFDEISNSPIASIASDEVERLELDHVVCVLDVLTGLPCVFGPFTDPISASTFASRFISDVGCDYEWALHVRVVPLDRISVTRPGGGRSLKEQFRLARHLGHARRFASRSRREM